MESLSLLVLLCMLHGRMFESVDDYLNVCLDGRHHKSVPGPEGSLFQACSPWASRSCCTNQTARDLHVTDRWYGFNMGHCRQLSAACATHFRNDLCFYECSPNVGPWLVEDKRTFRNEKFVDVPLCPSECDAWWDDCKNDLTCLADWSKGFNWTTGSNVCPADKPCRPFHEIYNSSSHFCEAIWGKSWKIPQPGVPCMVLTFDPSSGNPNDKVARLEAERLVNSGHTLHCISVFSILTVLIYTVGI